jgi:hypothetical protein
MALFAPKNDFFPEASGSRLWVSASLDKIGAFHENSLMGSAAGQSKEVDALELIDPNMQEHENRCLFGSSYFQELNPLQTQYSKRCLRIADV